MRKPVIAGNWKMNKTKAEAKEFFSKFLDDINTADPEVIICAPFTTLATVVEEVKGTNVKVGAQNMEYHDSGAYTGEISADMLIEADCTHVVIGHSERREYYGETDETVNKKTLKALNECLIPIVCVGETLEQREADETMKVIKKQIEVAMQDVPANDKMIIAYEPVWAIGTGKTATDEQANEVCAYIRKLIVELYGEDTAEKVRILYGGSVNAKNVDNLMGMSDIDGALVGGASLKEDFVRLVKFNR